MSARPEHRPPVAFDSGPGGGEAGFTLIELLVSLVLLAFLLLVVPSTIRLALRASATSAELMEGNDRAAAIGFVRRTLSEAMPLVEADENGKAAVALSGDAGALTYVTALAGGPKGGGLYRIRLEIVREGEDSPATLYLSLLPFDRLAASASTLEPLERRVLLGGLSTAAMRYYGTAPGQQGAEWLSAWPGTDRLPLLVEIDLAAPGATTAPLKVELKLAARR